MKASQNPSLLAQNEPVEQLRLNTTGVRKPLASVRTCEVW